MATWWRRASVAPRLPTATSSDARERVAALIFFPRPWRPPRRSPATSPTYGNSDGPVGLVRGRRRTARPVQGRHRPDPAGALLAPAAQGRLWPVPLPRLDGQSGVRPQPGALPGGEDPGRRPRIRRRL